MSAPFNLKWDLIDVASTKKDSGTVFSPQPRATIISHFNSSPNEASKHHIGRDYRMQLACNVMLIEYQGRVILVDTGPNNVGDFSLSDETDIDLYSPSKLSRMLRERHISTSDVTDVILTSKDKDHAGGTIYTDRAGNYKVRFSKATHYCHQSPNPRLRPHSTPQANFAFELMEESGQLNYLTNEEEIAPGIRIVPAFGPSAYASMVQIDVGADRVIFTGDVCPTSYHVTPEVTAAYDDNPDLTFSEKQKCVQMSMREGYLLAFSHAIDPKTCWVEENKEGFSLRTP